MGGARSQVPRLCTAIEAYFDALRDAGFALYDASLTPQTATAISGIESGLGLELPADVRVFLGRGLRACTGSVEEGERFASIGFNWLDARHIVRHTEMLRGVAGSDDDEHGALINRGFALTYSEPELVVAGSVWHFSFRNPLLEVGRSFTEFLAGWLGSGCFCSHDSALLAERTGHLIPAELRPARNSWLEAYRRQFPDL